MVWVFALEQVCGLAGDREEAEGNETKLPGASEHWRWAERHWFQLYTEPCECLVKNPTRQWLVEADTYFKCTVVV